MVTHPGFESPQFIIKVGEKYYLTTGVLEYDPGLTADNLTLKAGVEQIKKAYEAGTPYFNAAQIIARTYAAAAQTMPRGAQTRP